jgi:hypothetical protein
MFSNSTNIMKYAFVIVAVLAMTSCRITGERPRQLLTLGGVTGSMVYKEAVAFLLEQNYQILEEDPLIGYLVVESAEYAGERHGLVRWREKLTIEVRVQQKLTQEDEVLVLARIDREEKSPNWSKEWHKLSIDSKTATKLHQLVDAFAMRLKAKGANPL